MRRSMLLLAASVVAGCQSPLPAVNPQMAWVEFSTPFPNDKLLMAERLDKQRLRDGRFFQVTPGSHELIVRFDFEVPGGGGELGFDSREQLAAAIEALSVADLQRQFASLSARSLLVRSFGKSIRAKFESQETSRRADTAISALRAADAFVPGA